MLSWKAPGKNSTTVDTDIPAPEATGSRSHRTPDLHGALQANSAQQNMALSIGRLSEHCGLSLLQPHKVACFSFPLLSPSCCCLCTLPSSFPHRFLNCLSGPKGTDVYTPRLHKNILSFLKINSCTALLCATFPSGAPGWLDLAVGEDSL